MCRKFQLDILDCYQEILVKKVKVLKSLLNSLLLYLLPKFPLIYIIG